MTNNLMLEDNHEDIHCEGNAREKHGQVMLARWQMVSKEDIERLLRGEVLEDVISRIARLRILILKSF